MKRPFIHENTAIQAVSTGSLIQKQLCAAIPFNTPDTAKVGDTCSVSDVILENLIHQY